MICGEAVRVAEQIREHDWLCGSVLARAIQQYYGRYDDLRTETEQLLSMIRMDLGTPS